MSRRALIVTAATLAVLVTAGLIGYSVVAASASAGVIAVAGDVRVDQLVVRAPAIAYPTPDYTVGIPSTATASAGSSKKRAATSAGASRQPVVSGTLATVTVAMGDVVTTGQVLAQLDTTMLDLGVRQAQASRARAAANLDVIDKNTATIDSARAKLLTARANLVKTRASLATTIAVLARQQASLESTIAAIEKLIAQPGGPPPHVPPYPVLLAQLKSALAGLKQGLAGARTGLAKMDAGLMKMAAALAKIDSGRAQLSDVRTLAVINLRMTKIGLDAAETARRQATVYSPAAGVVTYARGAGSTVMVGAPVVRIRPAGPTHIYTYLTADQLARVDLGATATVTFDSHTGGPLTGHVVDRGLESVVPPTAFPTTIVHMTRAVRVTIQLDDGATAPPGTPVDVQIEPSR